jgi:hypothetical protein
MMQPPAFFELVRQRASARWGQLEGDPELAGPWHQLFKQVQSPRHVLSELLQNADDAGASEAFAYIADDIFVFEHNGEDFTEEHFASLCRFGYSNKRSLHTIGFRGIGFKSTFSLGDQVDLFTPSLAVRFHRQRFTEPQWLPDPVDTCGRTIIRVAISDQHRRREIEKNLEEWLESPVSLLFFGAIRRLHIGDRDLYWGSLGPGPLPDTEWMALHGQEDETFLLLHSAPEPFPEEALDEIRQERLLGSGEVSDFPPCKVDVVLGSEGRLYVVLPTGVQTALPFACNAPFIQDPARLKIKDPEISPTNRWLLERTGRLAASAMLAWLDQAEVPVVERAPAYGLFPDVDRSDNSLEGTCGTIVEEAFAGSIDGKSILLTYDGRVVPALQALSISREILNVWPPDQASAILDGGNRPAFCSEAKPSVLAKLQRWKVLEQIDKAKILEVLESQHLPKPKTWGQLLNLWTFIAPDITGYRQNVSAEKVRIVPVQGKDVLYASAEVVRLGDKKLLQSEKDWSFLAEYLVVANPNWHRFLAEQRRNAEERDDPALRDGVAAAYAILEKVGLGDASDVNAVVDRVATEFFSRDGVEIRDCVRLAQIAATLDARVGSAFRFVTRDRRLKPLDQHVLFDEDGGLEELLPEVQKTHLLDASYDASFESCSREEWLQWVRSGRSGLSTFIPLAQSRESAYGKRTIEQEAQRRGADGGLSYPYVTNHFIVEDWSFDDSCWAHWDALAAADDHVWANIVTRILAQREAYWSKSTSARILQVATTGSTRTVTYKPLLSSWVLRLRELPCVPDTRGFLHRPPDLLRRTADTESLMDVEPFVHARVDTEAHRPLLDLLGVRTAPTGPDRLIDCLRALSRADKPPIHEVEKWYRRLDQFLESCSTSDAETIKDAFSSERLILAADSVWATSSSVFLSPDEDDVPEAAVIRASVRELTLWRKIGVANRPTAELAIAWLKRLPSSESLSPDDVRRVRALLSRHPVRIWEACGHWLNLAGEWVPVSDLSYALTMQFLIPWKHLHEWVKQKTADLQRLPLEVTSNAPFSKLPPLAAHVEERTDRNGLITGEPSKKEWLTTFGSELRRVTFDSDDETQRVRAIADALSRTSWYETPGLEIIPYIDGTPAGTPRQTDVVWLDRALFVTGLPKAKLARRVPEEIGKVFARPDIKAALDYSFERPADDIREYIDENFALGADDPSRAEEQFADLRGEHAPLEATASGEAQESDRRDSRASAIARIETDAGESTPDDAGSEDYPATSNGAGDQPSGSARRSQKPAQPPLIELFASANGFRADSAERFFRSDGSWIGRSPGSPFPWEHHAASGELLRCYLPVNRCLEREPLELDADVWALLDRRPSLYALILQHPDGTPVELAGTLLRSMREKGDLKLYPARYRIVQESKEERHEA